MAKRRKKNAGRVIHLSTGPLPERRMPDFSGLRLVFTDASRLRYGGLAAVLYDDGAGTAPMAFTRCVALDGSNELELQAVVFGLEHVGRCFPHQAFALFSDNQDAITRLARVQSSGVAQDADLLIRFPNIDLNSLLTHAQLHWIKGHGSCRGNALADEYARQAASP